MIPFHPPRAQKGGYYNHGKGNGASARQADLPNVTRGNESRREKAPHKMWAVTPDGASDYLPISQHKAENSGWPKHQDGDFTCSRSLALCTPRKVSAWAMQSSHGFFAGLWNHEFCILGNNLSNLFPRVGMARSPLKSTCFHTSAKKKNLKIHQRRMCMCACVCVHNFLQRSENWLAKNQWNNVFKTLKEKLFIPFHSMVGVCLCVNCFPDNSSNERNSHF